MVIEIFNGNIAVPAKCGTRYFSKCIESPENPVKYMERVVSELPINSDLLTKDGWFKIKHLELWKKVEYLVVRDPLEHLKSAIHTEFVHCWDDMDKIKSHVESFTYLGTNPHWYPHHYRKIYFLNKNHHIPKFKILHMNQITDFLLSLGFDIKYIKDEYSFKHVENWKSKEECVDIFKTNFPIEWDLLMEMIEKDMEYYDIVVNNKVKLL